MMKKEKNKGAKDTKLRVISLGGLQEIGKNMTAIEYGDDIVVIDAGLGFPDDEMLGVDLVIPDMTYLVKNAHKIRGVLITHGHEDHIGAVPYLLQQINVPIYGTRLSLGIIEGKLDENPPPFDPELYTVEAGDVINLGIFKAEFIHVNHSIADSLCLAIKTPVGTIVHSGDFKIDATPVDGEMIDLTRLGEIGRAGVKLLMCESTNVEREGYTHSERRVGDALERYFDEYKGKRIIISTFSSNVHRVQQIIDIAAKYGRKVAVTGRSMINVIGAAVELDYMNVPNGVLIDIADIKKYPASKLVIVSTGSQGEPMSALYRMAYNMHDKVDIGPEDVVIISASAIPGNEKLVGNIINELYRKGVDVLSDSIAEVHVSGHACREELKIFHALTKPEFFMPIHGEARHLHIHKELAEQMGMAPSNIFVGEIGKVLEIDANGARFSGTVPAGIVLVDGYGVGDVGNVVLRDRKILSSDGIITIVTVIDRTYDEIVTGPEVISRGFVYAKESEMLIDGIKTIARDTINICFDRGNDWNQMKFKIKDEVAKYVNQQTKRKPMIVPIIMEIQ
jgi:ribonuclease J